MGPLFPSLDCLEHRQRCLDTSRNNFGDWGCIVIESTENCSIETKPKPMHETTNTVRQSTIQHNTLHKTLMTEHNSPGRGPKFISLRPHGKFILGLQNTWNRRRTRTTRTRRLRAQPASAPLVRRLNSIGGDAPSGRRGVRHVRERRGWPDEDV